MSLKLNERYPSRFNNPTAGYPQGSFKNRTTPTAKDGSYLEKDWANDKEGFFQSLLSVAGVTANGSVDAVGASQFFDALQTLAQNQAGVSFATSGTATAQVLTPTPAIQAYAARQLFNVTFNIDSGANPTINVSGKGAKSLKQYDSTGAKVAAVFKANQAGNIFYDGTDFVLLDQLPAGGANLIGIQGLFKNLAVSSTGLSALVTCTVDEIMVENASNQYQVLRSVSVAPSLAAAGANGLDTGTSAASTWYSVWVIWNGTTTAGLLSLSATAPTMPSGYTHKARVGWVRTDGTANKYPLSFIQFGRDVRYKVASGSNVPVLPLMASGVTAGYTAGSATWTPVAVPNNTFIPPTANQISIWMYIVNQQSAVVAPNNTSFAGDSSSTPPTVVFRNASATINTRQENIYIESANIYWGSDSATTKLSCFGWTDNL